MYFLAGMFQVGGWEGLSTVRAPKTPDRHASEGRGGGSLSNVGAQTIPGRIFLRGGGGGGMSTARAHTAPDNTCS